MWCWSVLSETVGARYPQGVNHRTDSAIFNTHAAYLIIWYLAVGASNSRGYPKSIRTFKQLILDTVEFAGLIEGIAVGASTSQLQE